MYQLYKRGEVYWARVNGERKSTRCRDEAAAHIVARRLEREAVDPAYHAQNEAKTEDAVGGLIAHLTARKRAEATIELNTQKGRHLVRLLPPLLRDVTAAVVDDYITTREGEGAKPVTVVKELSTLRQTLKLAIRAGKFARRVEEVLPVGYSREYVPRDRWLPESELSALMGRLDPRRAAHVAFIVATSARWAESVRAEREDIDFDRRIVRLRGSKTKSATRAIPIIPLNEDLLRFVVDHAPGANVLFETWGKVGRDLNYHCDRLGIERCSPNDLRRTIATWLRNAGVHPQLIAPFLGHTTSAMVETVYGRIDVAALGAQLASVPAVYAGPAKEGPTGTIDMSKTSRITAPPPRIERGTFGLGKPLPNYVKALKTALLALPTRGRVPGVYEHRRALRILLDGANEGACSPKPRPSSPRAGLPSPKG